MTIDKVLQSGLWLPTLFQYCKAYLLTFLEYRKTSNITKRDETPLNIMLEVKPFYCWGIDFMVPFPQSNSNIYV